MGRRWDDQRQVEVDMAAMEGERSATEQPPNRGQALVHAPPAGRRINPAHLDLVAVLAADADAEHQPARGKALEIGQLPGHQGGMAQWQQVHPGVDRQRRV